MRIHCLVVGVYQANCYIAEDEHTREAWLIDPGDEAEVIQQFLEKKEIIPKAILLTHGHIDHIGACAHFQKVYGIPLLMHEGDRFFVENATIIGGLMMTKRIQPPQISGFFQDGQEITLGAMKCKVLHTPGHSPGSVCFLTDEVLFSGDTLFSGSVGRTDLPGGDWNSLLSSIRTRIFTLPDHLRVLPGHGEATTILNEKRFNPFVSFLAR
ncbi:MAG: MBL fold metallo-hydrolase [bacterium JZ-2024 1]